MATAPAATALAGTVRAGTVRAGTVRAGTVRAGTVLAATVRAGTVRAGTVRAGTVRAATVLAATVLVLAGCASNDENPGHPAAVGTAQLHVSPVQANGSPASGFRTSITASNASCEPGSEAIGQAYRCFAGNYVYDPCWAVKAATPTVLCLPYPWSLTDVRLSVNAPLSPIPNEGGVGEPWGVELFDGQRCELAQGAHSEFDGHVIDYYCSPHVSLLRGLTRTGRLWLAHSVIEKNGKAALGPVEKIATIWFGTADRYR